MKKIIVWFVLLAMLLAGCNAPQEAAPSPETTPVSTQAPEKIPEEVPAQTEPPATSPATLPAMPPVEPNVLKLPTGYSLTEFGTFTEGDWEPRFRSDNVIIHREQDAATGENLDTLLGRMGTPIYDAPYYNIETITEDLLAVTPYGDNINCTGLITVDGELLIDYECAFSSKCKGNNEDI